MKLKLIYFNASPEQRALWTQLVVQRPAGAGDGDGAGQSTANPIMKVRMNKLIKLINKLMKLKNVI